MNTWADLIKETPYFWRTFKLVLPTEEDYEKFEYDQLYQRTLYSHNSDTKGIPVKEKYDKFNNNYKHHYKGSVSMRPDYRPEVDRSKLLDKKDIIFYELMDWIHDNLRVDWHKSDSSFEDFQERLRLWKTVRYYEDKQHRGFYYPPFNKYIPNISYVPYNKDVDDPNVDKTKEYYVDMWKKKMEELNELMILIQSLD